MVKDLDISDRSLRQIVKEDLGIKPCKIQQQELLSIVLRQKCFVRGKKILKEKQHASNKNLLLVE